MEEKDTQDAMKRLEVEKTTYKKIARMEQKAREKEKRAREQEQKAREKAEKAKEQAEKDVLKFKLSTALMKAVYKDNIPKEDAMKTFAKENNLPLNDVEKLAEGISL